ncbi:3-deoxy-D-manno-octulosonic acid transferase [Flavobacterium marginilacus]|uniref:3-deoxy-D-manno-octulosonic acid transferase n=1 Tax=Flavobacterium marginilacus TaxID=3003256 RepID=UPI00248E9EE6|nr:glycosyltransferase N-terminal domain-containing protein [Flavobacterium marginilacus]
MHFLYNLATQLAQFLVKITVLFSPKMKLFVDGRKDVFLILKQKIASHDRTIWFHSASLGEYEQGLPVIEKIKEKHPDHKIIISFFSPSGYEVRKNNTIADATVYLPLDTPQNAKRFVELVHPDLVFFIKYEFWINYLDQLQKKQIPTYLISGIFREQQLFFKWYGGFYRKALNNFTYFFVQNENSKKLITQLGKTNVTISGDTRFDRVAAILDKDNTLEFIAQFKNNKTTIVIGSSWPKDESLLTDYINSCPHDVKFIIAPHNIKPEQIQQLQNSITKKTVLFSEKENKELSQFEVFIIDTIGILTKIYSYGDIAYVGGGFGKGIHNLLEPATFGIPIVIGPNFSHFDEAVKLVENKGCASVKNFSELEIIFSTLIQNTETRHQKGKICAEFVQNNKGATDCILSQIIDIKN